jgi:hypothetical protein
MEPEGSLPYSQVPATCPYHEPTPSSPHSPSTFLNIHLNIILPYKSGSLPYIVAYIHFVGPVAQSI